MPQPDARPLPAAEAGIARDLVGFGRLLRRRGIGVGPDQAIRYRQALALVDAADLEDLYWAGRACLLTGRADVAAYDQAFAEHFLGRDAAGEPAPPPGAPQGPPPDDGDEPPGAGVAAQRERPLPEDADGGERAERATVGDRASALEVLRHKTFPAMTDQERALVRRLLRALRAELPVRTTRRTAPARSGSRLDLRRSVRRSLRTQGELVRRHWRRRRQEYRTVVLILDVSGSMAGWSRALLHFGYGLTLAGTPVEVFCFGTRLTRITDALRQRDPDLALERAAAAVVDWDGGTRIGESLRQFVRGWGRQGAMRRAVVVICSDGLERGDPAVLAEQMARLSRLAYRVLWVNPLAGDPDFQPVSRGMRAILPHVDELLAGDSVERLAQLAGRLGGPGRRRAGRVP
jgi:uncharacterized protein